MKSWTPIVWQFKKEKKMWDIHCSNNSNNECPKYSIQNLPKSSRENRGSKDRRRFADGFLSDGKYALRREENVFRAEEDLISLAKDLFRRADLCIDAGQDLLSFEKNLFYR
jgi:hypothetical protein